MDICYSILAHFVPQFLRTVDEFPSLLILDLCWVGITLWLASARMLERRVYRFCWLVPAYIARVALVDWLRLT